MGADESSLTFPPYDASRLRGLSVVHLPWGTRYYSASADGVMIQEVRWREPGPEEEADLDGWERLPRVAEDEI